MWRRSGSALSVLLGIILVAVLVLAFRDGSTTFGLSDGQFASLVHAGLWIGVLSAGVFIAFRHNVSGALRAALLWMAAFAVLIALYTYLPEANQLKDRMLSALMPGRVAALSGTEARQFMVQRGRDNHYQIDGRIDGTPTRFMVDTGASAIAMDTQTAERLGLDVSSMRFSTSVMTANGLAQAAPVTLDSVEVGGIRRRNVRALVTEGTGLGTVLLGLSFLDTLTAFEFRGDRLILTD